VTAEPTIRTATADDVPAVVSLFGRAFADRPPVNWMEPDAIRRARVMPVLLEGTLRTFSPLERGGEVLIDGGAVTAAAGWVPPGSWNPSIIDMAVLLFRMLAAAGPRHAGAFAMRARAVEDALRRAHPAEPHWYLAIIGTDPQRQGTGGGSTLMRSGLARCDRDRLPVYLECDPSLVPFYERFGFAVTRTIRMPGDCPEQVGMWRAAAPS
jgi:GNAT superfamily N-acetyltransferase